MGAHRLEGHRRRGRAGLLAGEDGTTSIEYALIASIVAIFAIGGLQAFGTETGALFEILGRLSAAIAAVLSG